MNLRVLFILQARTLPEGAARHAIVNAAGLVGSLVGRLQGIGNARGWSTVIVYLFFAAGYSAFAMRKQAVDTAVTTG